MPPFVFKLSFRSYENGCRFSRTFFEESWQLPKRAISDAKRSWAQGQAKINISLNPKMQIFLLLSSVLFLSFFSCFVFNPKMIWTWKKTHWNKVCVADEQGNSCEKKTSFHYFNPIFLRPALIIGKYNVGCGIDLTFSGPQPVTWEP